jgi:plasmid stabilization system protein ParE
MPASKPYHFHPEAWAEFETAETWYRQRSPDAALRFLAAVYDALEEISRSTQAWPGYLYGCRKYVLQQFPYAIIYREAEVRIEIMAVSHGHRRPGYWRPRL